jgi:hypothetical protein
MRPLKCGDFAKRRRFPVRLPRFTVIFPDFQRNNTQGGDYPQILFVEIAHQQRKKLKKTITQENLIPTCSVWAPISKIVFFCQALIRIAGGMMVVPLEVQS